MFLHHVKESQELCLQMSKLETLTRGTLNKVFLWELLAKNIKRNTSKLMYELLNNKTVIFDWYGILSSKEFTDMCYWNTVTALLVIVLRLSMSNIVYLIYLYFIDRRYGGWTSRIPLLVNQEQILYWKKGLRDSSLGKSLNEIALLPWVRYWLGTFRTVNFQIFTIFSYLP